MGSNCENRSLISNSKKGYGCNVFCVVDEAAERNYHFVYGEPAGKENNKSRSGGGGGKKKHVERSEILLWGFLVFIYLFLFFSFFVLFCFVC